MEWTQEQVLKEALVTFDKQAEYTAMMEEHRNIKAEEQLWDTIRTMLPVLGNSQKSALRGLRRWVVFENGEPRIAFDPILDDHPAWVTSMAPGSTETLLEWVKDNWEEAKASEKARAAATKAAATAN
jgi:hypothetical protein